MKKWLNYHHLYYFLQIAERGSIQKASEFLRIGQPALSVQLRQLEGILGQLFVRQNRGLVLTERGHVVLKFSKEIFSRGDELVRAVERGELSMSPELQIGAQEGVPKAILAKTIQRIIKATRAKATIREGTPRALLEQLAKGQLDLIISDQELTTKGVSYFLVDQESVSLWTSTKLQRSAKELDLQKMDFILPAIDHPLRAKIERFFTQHDLSPRIIAEVPDPALIKELGALGTGVICLGDQTVKQWVQAGRLKKLRSLADKQSYFVGIPKRELANPLLEKVISELR